MAAFPFSITETPMHDYLAAVIILVLLSVFAHMAALAVREGRLLRPINDRIRHLEQLKREIWARLLRMLALSLLFFATAVLGMYLMLAHQ